MNKFVFILLTFFSLNLAFSQKGFEFKDGILFKGKTPYTGIYTITENNITVSEIEMVEGVRNGKITNYFANKIVRETGYYQNGNKHGLWQMWDENGKLTAIANYDNGVKHGKWEVWDHKGTLRSSTEYANGKKAGTWKVWDENGNVLQESSF